MGARLYHFLIAHQLIIQIGFSSALATIDQPVGVEHMLHITAVPRAINFRIRD